MDDAEIPPSQAGEWQMPIDPQDDFRQKPAAPEEESKDDPPAPPEPNVWGPEQQPAPKVPQPGDPELQIPKDLSPNADRTECIEFIM